MFQLKNISKQYHNLEIFKDISLELKRGDIIALQGRSGSGKSTLLKLLAGLDYHYSGDYLFNGKMLEKRDRLTSAFRKQYVGFIPQDYRLLNDLTAFENVALPLKLKKIAGDEVAQKVQQIFYEFDIQELSQKYPQELSGGQCQLIAIARAAITSPVLLLADEPTSALDETKEQMVLNFLKKRVENGACVLISTHSKVVAKFCDDIYMIEQYKVKKRLE